MDNILLHHLFYCMAEKKKLSSLDESTSLSAMKTIILS